MKKLMTTPQRDETVEEIKRLGALLECAVMTVTKVDVTRYFAAASHNRIQHFTPALSASRDAEVLK